MKPFRFALLLAALTLAPLAGEPAAAQEHSSAAATPAPTQSGERIAAVRMRNEEGRVLEENPRGLPVEAGKPLDAEAVRESLRQMFRTGRYADVRAETLAGPDGVTLEFIVRQNFFVNRTRIVGLPSRLSEGEAASVVKFELGEVFREDEVPAALDRLRRALEEEGYYRAEIGYELAGNQTTRQMDITLRVKPGPPARIGEVALANRSTLTEKVLRDKSGLKPGKGLSSSRLERAARDIRKHMVKQGLLTAHVALHRGPYDAEKNSVPIEIEVEAGLKVRVEIEGAKVSDRNLRQLLPIYQEGSVDEDLLQEGRRNLRAHLERAGYFDSEVNYTVHNAEEENALVIRYLVKRGPKSRLVGVEFNGNRYFSTALLEGRLGIQPAAFLSPGRFNRRLLESDETSLRELYVANGFREARVAAELTENYRGKTGDLYVRFQIEEGPQTRVSALAIEGNAAFEDDVLRAYMDTSEGQPFSEFNMTHDRNNILALYYNEGFGEVRVDAHYEPADEPNRMRLRYTISEGLQARVARLLVDGNEHTRRKMLDRQISLREGEPLRQGNVIDSQRRLYDLGIFSRVQIAPQNPGGSDQDKTVVVLVEEAKRYTIAYGGGIEVQRLGGSSTDPVGNEVSVSPRGLFEITKANLTGRVDTLSLKLRGSSLQRRALLTYTTPDFLASPKLTFLFTALADDSQDVQTFRSQRYELAPQVVQKYSPLTTLVYRYAFRKVTVDPDSLRIPPSQIPLYSQPTRVSGPGIAWIRDRRDSPADPTRGSFDTFDFSVSIPEAGSSASFVRLFVQNATYHRVGRSVVFARSTRFGVEELFGTSVATDIPLPERFFAGGGNSLRGFSLNQAGPRDPDTGFPIGGLALLVFNQELRFPMRLPYVGDKVGGALFYDAGNVFSSSSRITLNAKPPSPSDLNYFSHTVGFGFRYDTPIGPVRLDLGYQLNPAQFAFTDSSGPRLERLPRFHFFFSIGPVF